VGLPTVSTTGPFGTVQGTKPAKSSSSPYKYPQKHQRTGTPPQLIFLLFVSLVYLLFILFAFSAPDKEKEDSDTLICDKGKDNTKEGFEDEVEQANLAHASMPVCCGLSVVGFFSLALSLSLLWHFLQ